MQMAYFYINFHPLILTSIVWKFLPWCLKDLFTSFIHVYELELLLKEKLSLLPHLSVIYLFILV